MIEIIFARRPPVVHGFESELRALDWLQLRALEPAYPEALRTQTHEFVKWFSLAPRKIQTWFWYWRSSSFKSDTDGNVSTVMGLSDVLSQDESETLVCMLEMFSIVDHSQNRACQSSAVQLHDIEWWIRSTSQSTQRNLFELIIVVRVLLVIKWMLH